MGQFRGIELDDLVLTGPRLRLRPYRPDDADTLLPVMQDPALHEFLALPNPYTLEDARHYVSEIAVADRRAGTGICAALEEIATGTLVGSCDLRLGEHAHIGYWVAPHARRHGYAAEATRVLADWGFAHGVTRSEVLCDVRNLPSARAALAAGFEYEGISRSYDHPPRDGTAESRPFDAARFARLATDDGAPITPKYPRLMPGALADGVISLRPVEPRDAVGWTEQELDPVTIAWAFDADPPPVERVSRLPARAGLEWLVGGSARLAIEDVETGRFAGSVQLRSSGPPDVGGIGYAVHPAFRGRGYTARALRLVVPWAFDAVGLARLELGAKAGNIASQKAAAAAGFEPDGVRVGRLRNHDGTFADEVRFALLNPRFAGTGRSDQSVRRINP